MKILRIKNIERQFKIECGNIYNLNVEDPDTYIKIVDACIENNNDYLLYYDDFELKDFEKNSLFIGDVFTIDSNSKKSILSLHKNISEKVVSVEDKTTLEEINIEIIELLQNISNKLDVSTTFDDELDFNKILSLYKFTFLEDNSDMFLKFVNYIKTNYEIKNFKFIISINVLPLFDNSQISLLHKELEYMGLSLININFIKRLTDENVFNITIDKDLCEY